MELEVLLGYTVSSESKPSERKVGEGQGREKGNERHFILFQQERERDPPPRLEYHKHQRTKIQRKRKSDKGEREKRESAKGPKLVGLKQTFAQCGDAHQ